MNVCLVGLGTVGFGVYEIINRKCKDYLNVYAVCDTDVYKKNLVSNVVFYNDIEDVISDDKIDIVVEMIGGNKVAYRIIKESLKKGKHVVTSNKEVVALHIDEFMRLSHEKGVYFLFEASVGGGVPIIKSLYDYSLVNDIDSIEGILNGSTNFILTKVQGLDGSKLPLDRAMQLAYEKGFLEKDPSNDLKGLDMKRKIAILTDIAFDTYVDIDDIYSYSLETITDDFIEFVNGLGFTIKYMARAKKVKNNKLVIDVEPVLVDNENVLTNCNNEFNYVWFYGDYVQDIVHIGKGAGRFPTATAVTSDITQIVFDSGYMNYQNSEEMHVCGVDNESEKEVYYIKTKEGLNLDSEIISKRSGVFVVTKNISKSQLCNNIDAIEFYARRQRR